MTMQGNIDNYAKLNEQEYLRTAADLIATSYGSPVDWGSSDIIPESLGLAKESSSQVYDLDIDKVCRLNNNCLSALSFFDASHALNLKAALGITLNQMLSIKIEPTSNSTIGETTTYNFKVTVKANLEPTEATLHGYVIDKEQTQNVSSTTSTSGVGNLSFQLSNTSNGTVLMVIFARATIDDRLTAYATYTFSHLSEEELPNQTFLNLSPLNNELSISKVNPSSTTLDECYALSFGHQLEPALLLSDAYDIPNLIEKSPIVLVTTGHNDSTYFIEYCAYPNVPLNFGSIFDSTDQNIFVYNVCIRGVLYKLTITLGEESK